MSNKEIVFRIIRAARLIYYDNSWENAFALLEILSLYGASVPQDVDELTNYEFEGEYVI